MEKFKEGAEIPMDKGKNPLTTFEAQNPELKSNQYETQSDSCTSVDTVVPASMRYDMHKAIETVDRRVNGVDEYVAEKLGYFVGNCSMEQRADGLRCLCDAFSAEQVDAIAVAIFNIEQKGQGCIIGDQTGIGKGRIAAGMIRYAINRGLQPIFLTEKPNLFSDLFRDIINIGSDDDIPDMEFKGYNEVDRKPTKAKAEEGEEEEEEEDDADGEDELVKMRIPVYKKNDKHPSWTYEVRDKQGNGTGKWETKTGTRFCKPFIVNGRDSKTDIKDEQGHILYRGDSDLVKKIVGATKKVAGKMETTIGTFSIPKEFDFVLATYSQFRGAVVTQKMAFLQKIAAGNIIIMDESHNASGSSNTGTFLKGVLKETAGVCFLSATFAKRPDNMPIYASKTSMSDTNMTDQELVNAINVGGVALQEIVASGLVSEGQMIRRERSFEGIEVNYEYLDLTQDKRGYPQLNKEQEHRAAMDKATDIIRDIMAFQEHYVNPAIDNLNRIAKAEYGGAETRKGTTAAGVDNQPIFSGIFNIINQLLFSIKAESVAEQVILRLKEGKKPVVAFANTMESFLNTMQDGGGNAVTDGDIVSSDFAKIFEKRLIGVLRYTVRDDKGDPSPAIINVDEQSPAFKAEYNRLMQKIKKASIGISSSPIDVLIDRIQKAGFSVVEVTGRDRQLKMLGNGRAMIKNRVKDTANDAFRKFNTNEVDCLMINQSGSTGASAHALPNPKTPPDKVKQRVMVILQAELNINTEVQKRGRINRTGQILKPIYDYVISAIPAEKRLMMMLQKKLKSLDANTTSNQKQSDQVMDARQADFLNKYGDQVVVEYLREFPLINKQIGDPFKLADKKEGEEVGTIPDAAHRASGRVAILSVKEQENFYTEISERYVSLVQYLMQTGEYDLEVEDMNLEAETVEKMVVVAGKGGESVFGRNSILEKCTVNNLRKPFKKSELDNLLKESLGAYTPENLKKSTLEKYERFIKTKLEDDLQNEEEHWENIKADVLSGEGRLKKDQTVGERLEELEETKIFSKQQLREKTENKKDTVLRLFAWFHVGRVVAYPGVNYSVDRHYDKGVFLGFDIKETAKNPYAPSALKLRFAIAGSQKYVAVPASKWEIINTVKAVSQENIFQDEQRYVVESWDEIIKEKTGAKATRYIVTGNILQAYSNPQLKGSLISYTTNTGGVKKGILLPESFSTEKKHTGEKDKELKITVPLIKALPILRDLTVNAQMTTSDNFTFVSRPDDFRLIVPISKKLGGQFYLDEFIMKLTSEKKFNSTSGTMVATIERRKIDNLVEYMQEKFNSSVQLSMLQFERIKDSIEIVDYNDEEKKPEPVVFVDNMAEEDVSEAAARKKQQEEEAFQAEQQANAAEEAERENNDIQKRKAFVMKKLHNLRRLLEGKKQ